MYYFLQTLLQNNTKRLTDPRFDDKEFEKSGICLVSQLEALIQNKGSQTGKKKRSFIMGIILIGFKQNKINVQFEVLTTIIKLDE